MKNNIRQFPFFSTLLTVLYVVCYYFISRVENTFLVACANNEGALTISLFYYTYGGSYSRYGEYNDNKMVYNAANGSYSIDIVLFENDYFVPNITGQGFVYYSDNLSEKTKEAFIKENISVHMGGNQFHVDKSGTYRISISSHIDSYSSKEDFYKIWDDEQSEIKYLSSSTRAADPLGSYDIYMVGNFDQAGWNGSRKPEMMFSYNYESECYEYYCNLYDGDIFCPESVGQKRFKYYKSDYTDKMFEENHIGESGDGYFVCKKDGYYKIALNYRIEYLYDNYYIWSKEIGSSITYLNNPVSPSVKGNETIILTGMIGGVNVMVNSMAYSFSYDCVGKQYKILVYLKKEDYIRPYLVNNGKYIYCWPNRSFLKRMCDGANIDFVTTSNIASLRINLDGYYEIVIGANIENLQDVSLCWLPHSDSYIRFLGNNVNSIFVTSFDCLENNCNAYTTGDKEIKQYGLDGIKINSVNYISLDSNDAKGCFYKLDYDPVYTNSIKVVNINNEIEKVLTISPESSQSYDFNTGVKNIYLGNACIFLSTLSNFMDGIECEGEIVADFSKIEVDQAKQILNQYNALKAESKKYVDEALIATVDNYGKKTSIHFEDIIPFLNSIINNHNQEKRTLIVVYIMSGLTFSIIVGLIMLSFKRKRSNKKIIVVESLIEHDSIKIDI